jgi:hypothetical protein
LVEGTVLKDMEPAIMMSI